MMENTYLKELTLVMLTKEFKQGWTCSRLLEMEMNLADIREGSRSPGCHAAPIMREMDRWFNEQMDKMLTNERRWIDQIKDNVLIDDDAMENLRRIGMEARWRADESHAKMCQAEDILEHAKRRFIDTEIRIILLRKREERETYLEYIMHMEAYYSYKLEIHMYERIAAMISNIRPILEW